MFSAVQMMAEAHLKSLEREELSSGEEEDQQQDDEDKQQTASAMSECYRISC